MRKSSNRNEPSSENPLSIIDTVRLSFEEVYKNNELVINNNLKLLKSNTDPALKDCLKEMNDCLLTTNEHIDGFLATNSGVEEDERPKGRTPDWVNHYSVLSARERDDPISAIISFAGRDNLFNDRNDLNLLLFAAMQSSTFEFDDPDMKGHRMYVHDSLLTLVEAAHRVRELYLQKALKLPSME